MGADLLNENLERLKQELPELGPRLAKLLPRAQFPIQSIKRGKGPPGQRPWLLHTKPADHLRQSFGLAPELLLLILPADEAFARDIQQAERQLNADLRLDPGLILVIASDPKAPDRLRSVIARTGRRYLFLDREGLFAANDPQDWLRRELRRQLGSADLFAPASPVTGWDFFGRERELDLLCKHLRDGRAVSLYGLRKIGKTSLALRCLKQLTTERGSLCLHIDLQTLAYDHTSAGFMRQLLRVTPEALAASELRPEDLEIELPDKGQLRRMTPAELQRRGSAVLEGMIDWAKEQGDRQVILFIDEYERLFENELFPEGEARRILDLLRGQAQTSGGHFTFVIAGLTGRFAAQSRLGEHQNPLFNFTVSLPLAGLERARMREMLRTIGRRVGLDFKREALEQIAEASGGHPWLAREFGRLVDRHVPLSDRVDLHRVDSAELQELQGRFAVKVDGTMLEIARAVDEVAPVGALALAQLAHGSSLPALHGPTAASVDQLRDLGIIDDVADGWRLTIGCFADWLRKNYPVCPAAGTPAPTGATAAFCA